MSVCPVNRLAPRIPTSVIGGWRNSTFVEQNVQSFKMVAYTTLSETIEVFRHVGKKVDGLVPVHARRILSRIQYYDRGSLLPFQKEVGTRC